jgi:acetylornithine deacetylase/succinyl-diaminopimelate desuccinylase-like protein
MLSDVLSYIDDNVENALEDLKEICRIPSIAAKNQGLDETANLVKRMLESIGLQAQLHPTSGAPVVTGLLDVGAKSTLLIYDHYDVQPAEPLDLWKSPPFEPEIRNGRFYARGPADNKGDFVSRIWAIKAYVETNTNLPVNIKFVVEGEEEIGSVHLHEFTEKNSNFLKADGGIWEFGGFGFDGVQEAWLGLKGIFYVQLEVKLLSRNVHSSLACILPSAPYRLVWALSSLKDRNDRILIDGFYDDIQPLTEAEKSHIKEIDLYEEDMTKHYGIYTFLKNLKGDELKEAYYNAPTCNICGLTSGYQAEGSMTVLPESASAKIDFRLVEGMNPEDIKQKLRIHLDKNGFSDVKIAWYEGYPAAKTPVDHPFVEIVKRANQKIYGDLRIHITSPGSGPLYLFKEYVPMVSIGCSDFESRGHSPNESISVDNYPNAIKRIALVIDEMGNWNN